MFFCFVYLAKIHFITFNIFIYLLFLSLTSFSQEISGSELLEKAIKYHDPNNNWLSFNGIFNVTMETPNNLNRITKIVINLPKEHFYLKAKRNNVTTEYNLNKNECSITLNGKTNLTDEELKAKNLSCKRAHLFKNYYIYLYGLPMKLKDKGTIIDNKVEQKTFKGKNLFGIKSNL